MKWIKISFFKLDGNRISAMQYFLVKINSLHGAKNATKNLQTEWC
ncbi:hypothetical protein N480_22310 [Pseudoalteromonas luteoviolacea S2607]|nr:hypothetical protein N480_22310 [Pseudoalteromonas luteoviolacea S2607]